VYIVQINIILSPSLIFCFKQRKSVFQIFYANDATFYIITAAAAAAAAAASSLMWLCRRLFQEGVHQRANVRLHEHHDAVQGPAGLL